MKYGKFWPYAGIALFGYVSLQTGVLVATSRQAHEEQFRCAEQRCQLAIFPSWTTVPTLSNLAPRPAGAPAVDISFRRFFTSAAAESRKTEAAWAETARRKTLQELTACIDSEFHDPSITAARLKEYDAKDQAAQNTEFNRCSCRTGFHHLCVAPGRGHGQRQWRYRFWADDILIHEYVTPDQDGQLHYGPARASRANENAQ